MKNNKQTKKLSDKATQKLKSKPSSNSNKTAATEGERIQKVLARGGVGSRREIESWIEQGKFQINGKPVKLGTKLHSGDRLHLNGRVVYWEKYTAQPTRVLIYHKPTGEVVTRRDPEGRPVIFTQLPKLSNGRWVAVGRLDINTQGLILVTNNGELANRLMHPSSELEREYAVRILGEVSIEMLENLQQGVKLDDGLGYFDDIKFNGGEGANKWYHVVVKEGRNRLVRRLWESQGVTVSRLIRVRYGLVKLPERIKAHTFSELDTKDLAVLMQSVGLETEKPPVKQAPHKHAAGRIYRKRK